MPELKANVKVEDWYGKVMECVADTLKRHVRSEGKQVEMFNEIAKKTIDHAVKVEGPIYLNPFTHDVKFPETTTVSTDGGEITSVYNS